jgi:hypothetical protein
VTDENGVLKRPSFRDDFVRRRAAELALPEVRGWVGAGPTDEDIIKDLMKCLSPGDGYEMCRDLERNGWAVNSELVEILNDGDFISTAKLELVVQWVKCLRVTLNIPLDAQVDYRGKPGKIVKLFPDTAEYGIHTPDLEGNSWYVLAAEDVKLPAPPTEAAA